MTKAPEPKAGLKAETARPQASPDMTGKQSMPEQKTKLGVSTVCIKPNGGQMGAIKGGDAHAYLGHFRSPEVLKRGHNQGAPGGSLSDYAAGLAKQPSTSGATDMPPPMAQPPVTARPSNPPPAMGVGNRRSGAGGAAVPTRGAGSTRGSVASGRAPGAPLTAQSKPSMPGAGAMNPKAKLRSAVGNVKMARSKLAGAIKGEPKVRGMQMSKAPKKRGQYL
jgi:hypothetical protein